MQITVGDFIQRLRAFDPEAVLDFQGLDFGRLKQRGDRLVQVEFEQVIGFDATRRIWSVHDPR